LSWLGERTTSENPLVELVLARFLVDDDADLREAACAATRLLPGAQARFWLPKHLGHGTDAEVKKTFTEELESWLAREVQPPWTS
jgi:hypothetical protein